MIIATAGHVDHGKTALVRRLTGIDTDRLPEEQKRGMTIDLGFAYVDAFGTRTGFVDVPGHERFLHNMLVGASGIDLALLAVAADDGVMPQTREHVQVLNVLGVSRAVVAITKSDRASAERIAEVQADVAQLLAATAMCGATSTAVSSITGDGIDELRAQITAMAAQSSPSSRAADCTQVMFRLAVDRAFTVTGTGTVVTGFVHAGQCARGEELLLLPAGTRVRVRGIHANDAERAHTQAGQRAALALSNIERDACARGSWLVSPDSGPLCSRLVAALHPDTRLPGHKDWLNVHLHVASNHIAARLHAWTDELGRQLVELRLNTPLPLVHGDRFVLRDTAAVTTLGGGTVLDPYPPTRGVKQASYARVLAKYLQPDPAASLAEAVRLDQVVGVDTFRHAWNLQPQQMSTLLESCNAAMLGRGAGARALGANLLGRFVADVASTVVGWHKANPHVRGIRADQLHAVLRRKMPADIIAAVAEHMVEQGKLTRSAGFLQSPGHAPHISQDDTALWQRIAPILAVNARPPALHDIARRVQADVDTLRTGLRRLAFAGLAVQVSDNRFFPAAQIDALMQLARDLDDASKGEGFLATAFRDGTELGRNLAIEVLEHFDQTGFTVRKGDRRHVSRIAQAGRRRV